MTLLQSIIILTVGLTHGFNSYNFNRPLKTKTHKQTQEVLEGWLKKAQEYDLPIFWLSNLHMATSLVERRKSSTFGLMWEQEYLKSGKPHDVVPFMTIIDMEKDKSNIDVIGVVENPDNKFCGFSSTWLSYELNEYAEHYNDTITFDSLNNEQDIRWYMMLNYNTYFAKMDDYVYNTTSNHINI